MKNGSMQSRSRGNWVTQPSASNDADAVFHHDKQIIDHNFRQCHMVATSEMLRTGV